MAYIATVYTVTASLVTAYIVMAYVVMAYVVMARTVQTINAPIRYIYGCGLCSYGLCSNGLSSYGMHRADHQRAGSVLHVDLPDAMVPRIGDVDLACPSDTLRHRRRHAYHEGMAVPKIKMSASANSFPNGA